MQQRAQFFQVVVNGSAGQQHFAPAGEARTEQHVQERIGVLQPVRFVHNKA